MASAGTWQVRPLARRLSWQPPGDVRAGLCALACAALGDSPSSVWGVAECEPLISLRRVLAHLGVQFVKQDDEWLIVHPPHDGLAWSGVTLDCGLSYETMLLALGVCTHAGQEEIELLVAEQLPPDLLAQAAAGLAQFGFDLALHAAERGCRLSLGRNGSATASKILLGPSMHLLKPMLMLAALASKGEVTFDDHSGTPDHAERALQTMGVEIERDGRELRVRGVRKLRGKTLRIPPDISAALPLILACAARPDSQLELPIAGVNPTRTAHLRCLARAGAEITRLRDWQFGNEPVAVLEVKGGAELRGFSVPPNAGPSLLSELLPLAAFASQCAGETRIAGLAPLRERAPDRVALALQMLQACGVQADLTGNVITVSGPATLHAAELNCADNLLLGQFGLTLALLCHEPVLLHGMAALDQWWPELRGVCTASGQVEAV